MAHDLERDVRFLERYAVVTNALLVVTATAGFTSRLRLMASASSHPLHRPHHG